MRFDVCYNILKAPHFPPPPGLKRGGHDAQDESDKEDDPAQEDILQTRGKMASETFDEQNLPGHKNGYLVTKSYLATKVITMVKLFIYF